MKKETKSNVVNNSSGITVTDDQNVKITSESTAVLIISENGAFKCRASNAGTKEQKEKMKKSWVYSKTKKGEWQSPDGNPEGKWFPLKPGTKPKNWYEGPKCYNEPEYHKCVRRVVLNSESVQYYTSVDSFSGRSKKERSEWEGLSKLQRLIRNAETIAYPGEIISIKIVD